MVALALLGLGLEPPCPEEGRDISMTCPQSSLCRSGRPLALEGPRRSQEWALPVGQGIYSSGLQGTEPSRWGPLPAL